jgi:hypothetical protein
MVFIEGAAQGRAAVAAGAESDPLCFIADVGLVREIGVAQLADVGEEFLGGGFSSQGMEAHFSPCMSNVDARILPQDGHAGTTEPDQRFVRD